MRRAFLNRYPRLVLALMVMAAMFSSGGFAKHAHLWSAHSHGACAHGGRTTCASHPVRSLCGSSRGCDALPAPKPSRAESSSALPSHVDGECAVCAELAFLTPTLELASPFTTFLAVLAVVHDREAAQLPAPAAPDACAARPPPAVA